MLVDHGLEILSEQECMDLLSSAELGRIAVSVSALPAVFPVNYRLVNGDVLFLTGDGIKSQAALQGAVVCFEVDEVDAANRTGWSVMVVGQAQLVQGVEREAYAGVHLSPWAGGAKSHLVRIRPEFVSGRRIAG